MYRRWMATSLLGSACLISVTWLFAQKTQNPLPKLEYQPSNYSIIKTGNDDLLLDSSHGKTWMLRRLDAGDVAWLPILRIDSEKEATQLWRKSANRTLDNGKSETPLSLDKILKGRGYLSIPLNRGRAGYFHIDANINGKKVHLMLDTGAPMTHFDTLRTKHLKLQWKQWGGEGKEKSVTVGTSTYCEISKIEVEGIEVGPLMVGGQDSSDINDVLKMYLDPTIDGQLGSDVLSKLNAIIDYPTLKLYLRAPDK